MRKTLKRKKMERQLGPVYMRGGIRVKKKIYTYLRGLKVM